MIWVRSSPSTEMSLRCKAGQNPSVGKVNCLWMGKLSGECVRCSCCEALCSGSLPQYTFTGFLCNSRAFSGCLYDDIKAETFSFVYGICIVHAKLLDLFAYLWTIIWLHWMETKSFTGHVRSHISGFFCTVTVQKNIYSDRCVIWVVFDLWNTCQTHYKRQTCQDGDHLWI